MTPEELKKALADGIISKEQYTALRKVQTRALGAEFEVEPSTDNINDENIRLVGGGNDMFVSLGIVLLLFGGFSIIDVLFGGSDYLLFGVSMLGIWLAAEAVTRIRRMRFSSTILALAFITCATLLIGTFTTQFFDLRQPQNLAQAMEMRNQIGFAGMSFFGSVIIASFVYFWRFRVPILAAAVALSLTFLVFQFSVLYVYDNLLEANLTFNGLDDFFNFLSSTLYIPLVCGLVIFGIAVMLDLHDKKRQTIWSDCAFWLHVISAPLLVHPLFILTTGQTLLTAQIEGSNTAGILLAVLILGFVYVALAIDRRSLLVPTLAYFGFLGVAEMARGAALSTGIPPFALVLIAIGTLIIVFGAGWQRIRALTVGQTLPKSWLNKLPPIKTSTP